MYDEINTKCNLPAQIDIEATEGMDIAFYALQKVEDLQTRLLSIRRQRQSSIRNPGAFPCRKDQDSRYGSLSAYHIAFVIGGTSAECNLLTVKLASCRYYDSLPTTGDETDALVTWSLKRRYWKRHTNWVLELSSWQYLAHDIRIVRCPATCILSRR